LFLFIIINFRFDFVRHGYHSSPLGRHIPTSRLHQLRPMPTERSADKILLPNASTVEGRIVNAKKYGVNYYIESTPSMTQLVDR
jgi:hypothetical protein